MSGRSRAKLICSTLLFAQTDDLLVFSFHFGLGGFDQARYVRRKENILVVLLPVFTFEGRQFLLGGS